MEMYHLTTDTVAQFLRHTENELKPFSYIGLNCGTGKYIAGPFTFGFLREDSGWSNAQYGILGLIYLLSDMWQRDYFDSRLSMVRVSLTEADQPYVLEACASNHQARYDCRIPLAEYRGQHEMPEVIIANPVPNGRLEFLWSLDPYEAFQFFLGQRPSPTMRMRGKLSHLLQRLGL